MLVLSLGRFGEEVSRRIEGAKDDRFRFASAKGQEDLENLLAKSGEDKWVSILADVGETESRRTLEGFVSKARGLKPPGIKLSGYLGWSLVESAWFRRVFCPGNPFDEVYVFGELDSLSPGPVAEMALRLHASLANLKASSFVGGTRYFAATAIDVGLAGGSPGSLARFEAENELLAVAYEVLAALLEELRRRLEAMGSTARIVWRDEEDVAAVAVFLDPVLEWLRRALLTSDPTPWRRIMAILSRGFEAEDRLISALERLSADALVASAEDLVRIVVARDGRGGANSEGVETGEKEGDDQRSARKLAEGIPKNGVQDIVGGRLTVEPNQLRDGLAGLCERALFLLDNPWVFKTLLKSLLAYAWAVYGGASPEIARGHGSIQERLLPFIQRLQGESYYLISPIHSISPAEQEEIVNWLERSLSKPCGIAHFLDVATCLYVEKAFDPCAGFSSSPEIPAEPLKAIEVTPSPEEPGGGESPAQRVEATCPSCGSAGVLPPKEESLPQVEARYGDPPLICPACGRLNVKDWWWCRSHGKSAIPIPIDKDRCPECIIRHIEDPSRHPIASIGVRPGLAELRICPHCQDIRRGSPEHKIFIIADELFPFYVDGVNGHQVARFRELALKYRLVEGCCCPHCGTVLIPVDHRKRRLEGHPTLPPR